MGKITDALKKAAEEKLKTLKEEIIPQQLYILPGELKDCKVDPHVVAYHDKTSPITEQYRVLRTNLQSINTEKPPRMIVVSSAIHNEGKSVSALNLAMTLATDPNNKGVLLIDADLRKGKIDKLLGMNVSAGLSEILCNDLKPEQAFVKTPFNSLTILPRGGAASNPAEILSSAKMKNFLFSLKSKFDYIIIDSPPIIPLADPGILGAMADGVVMAVQMHRTQRGIVRHAQSLLEQAKARLLGFILTKVEHHIPHYIYRYL